MTLNVQGASLRLAGALAPLYCRSLLLQSLQPPPPSPIMTVDLQVKVVADAAATAQSGSWIGGC